MGLDMYLNASKYLATYDETSESAKQSAAVKRLVGAPGTVKNVVSEIGYWRKANHIHAWFVKNVQDGVDECQEVYVSRDHLRALKKACEAVLADNTKATELLPTQSGFFFGGTEYDEWYFKDIEDTVAIIDDALKVDESWSISYRSSW